MLWLQDSSEAMLTEQIGSTRNGPRATSPQDASPKPTASKNAQHESFRTALFLTPAKLLQLQVVPDHLNRLACMPADTPASLNDCWLPDTPLALSCLPALKQLLAPCLASAADSAGMSKSDWDVLEWLTASSGVGSACCGCRIAVRQCSLNKSDQREMGCVQRAPKTQAQNLQQARMFSMKAFEQLCSLLLPRFSNYRSCLII